MSIRSMTEQEKVMDDDFIAFDDDEAALDPVYSVSAPFAEGQPDLVSSGRKRKADEMERDSNYTKKQKIAAESRHTPWADRVDWDRCTNVAQMLNEEVKAFVHYVSPTPAEHETRTLVVQWIRRAIVNEYPDAEVLPFGSFETGLYLPSGDIDLVVKSNTISRERDRDRSGVLYRLASILRRANITDNVDVIAKAKVPIIKFVTSHGRFPIDISISQINGLTAGRIVNRFIAEIPALRPLALVIKSFLNQRSMNEVFTGGLGSYSIVCMVTSFLQMHPKIRRSNIDPAENLGVLLVEFFETYGRFFQYEHVGISLRDGGHYFNKHLRGWSNRAAPTLLSIEDPQDPTNDVSSGSYGMHRVRQTLLGAYEILSAALCLRASELVSRRSGSYRSLHDSSDDLAHRSPAQLSFLGSIMGITQETINRRKVVAELHASGVLHKILGVHLPSRVSSPPYPTYARQSPPRASSSRRHRSRTPDDSDSIRRDRRKAEKSRRSGRRHDSSSPSSRRRHAYIVDDSSDDAWNEASKGAQEAFAVHTVSSSSDEGENGAIVLDADIDGAENDDDKAGGRYSIRGPRAKRSRLDANDDRFAQTPSRGDSGKLVTYVGGSEDSGEEGDGNERSNVEALGSEDAGSNEKQPQDGIPGSPDLKGGRRATVRRYWASKSGLSDGGPSVLDQNGAVQDLTVYD